MEAVECGAAALAIVLGYHGRHVSLEELRLACGISRDGSKAGNLVKAARQYGLIAKGFKKEPASLGALPLPLVVFWEFNHFLVVEGFGPNRVYLNDPACGPRVVTVEEFDRSFTGVVLTFEPGPDFAPSGERPSLLASLKRRLAGSEAGLAYVVLAGLALIVPGLLIPVFSQVFVDYYLVGGLDSWIGPLLIGMGLTAFLRGALAWAQQHFLLRLETKFALDTASRFVWHVLRLPIVFFSQRYGGEIAARASLNDRVAQLLSGQLATTLVSLALAVFFAILMFQYDPALTLVSVLIAVLNLAGLRLVARRRADVNQALLQRRGKLLGATMGGLQIIETLKAGGSESDFFARWAGLQANVMNAEQQLGLASQVLAVAPPFLGALNTLLILTLGGLRVMDGSLSMGQLVAFQSLAASFMAPINQFVELGGALQEAQGDLRRLDDVLRYPRDPQTDPSAAPDQPADKLSGRLELRNVTFGYSRLEPPLIQDFSLTLAPGARVALVGSSGSGKSTVAKLVAGLYEPWSGDILFDGLLRSQIPRSVLNHSVAMVDQDIFLFEGSVRDNLTLWDAALPEAVLTQAARDAAIHEEISARAAGYDYWVQEGGRNYSGGQRQRLEIARALANRPTILVLDEATSALDAHTEKRVDDSLRRRGCTCLIVAHRLSTIRDCDEIIVLERGRVVQRGSHSDLARDRSGPYARLIELEAPAKKSLVSDLLESI
jgi:NHLM bacteriocin system ABC transporter peptidase/ATP-binding protein